MKLPYITINWDKLQRKIVVGFAIYRVGIGCVLWCDEWKNFCELWPIA